MDLIEYIGKLVVVFICCYLIILVFISYKNHVVEVENNRTETEITCVVLSVEKVYRRGYTHYETIVYYDNEVYTITDKDTYFLYKDYIDKEVPALFVKNWSPLGDYYTVELPTVLAEWE